MRPFRLRRSVVTTFITFIAALLFAVTAPSDSMATVASFTFTAPNPGWVVALLDDAPLADVEGDTPTVRDIVGDATHPLLFLASDASHIYFRLRVDSDPRQNATNFAPFGWGCFINTDSNFQTYEYSTIIDGVDNKGLPDQISFFRNTSTTLLNSPNDDPDLPAVSAVDGPLTPSVGHAQVTVAGDGSNFGGNADYFIDWAIELSAAVSAGYLPGTPAWFYCGSSNSAQKIDADCSGSSAGGCPLDSQFAGPVTCDGAKGCGVCGDGVLGGTEGCDDGNDVAGDGCDDVCRIETGDPDPCDEDSDCASDVCDNGLCVCDEDADCPSGQLCDMVSDPSACVDPGCGNNIVEPLLGEACDDGNTTAGDGCGATCLLELGEPCPGGSGTCESGFCDAAGTLCACDQHADCPSGQLCDTVSNPNLCVAPGCGNHVLEAAEGCDDGNLVDDDGCSSACLLELDEPCPGGSGTCESGFCDSAGTICACDQHADCPSGQLCDTVSNPNLCVAPGCGNHVLEAAEGCDDGNLIDDDGCSSACLLELGEPCPGGGGTCESGFCDAAGTLCACDQNDDCPSGQLCNTVSNPNVCVAPGCGNSVIDTGEGCDDGNVSGGDGCSPTCLLELGEPCPGGGGTCESGFCDPSGTLCACDQHADCPSGQVCDTVSDPNACVAPGCGNNVLDTGEGCDDGNATSGDGCSSACLLELGEPCPGGNGTCESGFCDAAGTLCACDQTADCPSGQLCNTLSDPNLCVAPGCGNHVLEAAEGCDDGNLIDDDGCSAACLLELGEPCPGGDGTCESGFCDAAGTICACDETADCASGQLCNTVSNPNLCVDPGCGNQVLEAGEACDDGNATGGDGCSSACLLELGEPCPGGDGTCESGFCDAAGTICACDETADCPSGQLCNTVSNPNLCADPGCGNHVLEAGEGCDDGNLVSGDGCSGACLIELTLPCPSLDDACESNFCDPADDTCACDQDADCPSGEVCDMVPAPNACVPAGCGNNVLETSEGCDDGNQTDGDGCSDGCLIELGLPCPGGDATCESGFCDADGTPDECACDADDDCGQNELCNTALSPNECVPSGCGNDVLETGEGCDDGNLSDGDGCTAQCLLELGEPCPGGSPTCASGFCDPDGAPECACDQNVDCPAGLLCDTVPNPNDCVPSICGDGSIDGAEECDDLNIADGDGCSSTCVVEAGWTCSLEPSTCVPEPCASDADCPFCNEQYLICVSACSMRDDCPNGFFCDTTSQICVPLCTMGSECPSGICDTGSGECVECVIDADCGSGETCSDNVCGPGCGSNADCEAPRVCDVDDGICVECVTSGDCGSGLTCVDSYCLPGCNEEVDCGGLPCNETTGVCIECTADEDCAEGEICDEPIQQCIPAGCDEDSDCPDGQVCDEPNAECVPCTEDSDCGEDSVCDEGIHECVPCVDDGDCGEGVCDDGTECVECTEDSDCGEALVCDEGVHECVGCIDNSDCLGHQTCETASRTCMDLAAQGGGCGCELPRRTNGRHATTALALMLALAVARKRRRRSS